MNLKDSALGSIIRLNYPEHHQLVFEAGRPVRYDLGEGFAAVTGEIEFADGYPGFFRKLCKNREQVFPYRFRVLPVINTMPMLGNIDGWSRPQECDHEYFVECTKWSQG